MRCYLVAILTLVPLSGTTWAQNIVLHDPPTLYVTKQPPTRHDIELRHSLYKYVDGLQLMHDEKYGDALRAFEEAAKLDPNAPAIVRAQIPLLIGLDRLTDALNACKKVTELDADDFSTWYVQAKLQKSLVRYDDAIASLERGVKSAELKNHPEAAQQMYLDLGGLYESAEKFAPAADAFNKAAAILEHPDRIAEIAHVPLEAVKARASATYERIGQLYRKAKHYDDAIAALTKAKDRAPERAGRLSYLLAQVCDEAGQFQQALTHLDVYVRTQPLGIEAYEMKVDLLRRLKQPDVIVPWLEETAARDRFNNALLLLLARECVAAKETRKGEAVYKKLAEDSPSTELYRGLFNIYKDEGPAGMTRVLTMLDQVMDKAANEEGRTPHASVQHAKAMLGALREDGDLARKVVETAFQPAPLKQALKFDTLYFLAVLADKHRQTDEAERFYRQCLRDKKAQGNEPILYNGLLRTLMKARKHEAVVELCQQGLKNAKATNPLLFYGDMARAQAGLKHYDEALKTIESALAQPGASDLTLRMLRVRILAMAERYDAAETEGKALIKTYSKPAESVELHYLLSNVYAGAKRQADAESELQTILKIDPDNPTVNNDLGYLWAEQGKNLKVAEDMIRKALEVDRSQRRRNPNLTTEDDKDNAAYVDSLGWVLFRRGQIEEAKKELERATTLDEGADPTIYDHLGDVYSRLRMHREASRAWQRAVELYKDGIRGNDEERVRDLQKKLSEAKAEIGGR